MGKRSRKRSATAVEPDQQGSSTRAERDAARQRRARAQRRGERPEPAPRAGKVGADQRPKPIWAPFPLTELVTFAGLALMVWGFASGAGENGTTRLVTGVVLASLAGLELALREHLTGFRSHSSLLAGALALIAVVVFTFVVQLTTVGVLVIVAAAVFAGGFFGFRALFRRRSGGLSFR